MAIFKEAEARLFNNVFICRRCEGKSRFPRMKVIAGKAKCLHCSSPYLRPVRKIAKK